MGEPKELPGRRNQQNSFGQLKSAKSASHCAAWRSVGVSSATTKRNSLNCPGFEAYSPLPRDANRQVNAPLGNGNCLQLSNTVQVGLVGVN